MASSGKVGGSHLFAVRVWQEEIDRGHFEWRGRVEHIMSGQAGSFRQWSDMVDFMMASLPDAPADGPRRPGSKE